MSGRILAIGGGEDPDEDHMEILPYFVRMCGGGEARIIICGAPSQKPDEKERTYDRLFRKIGAGTVVHAEVKERPDADRPGPPDAVRHARRVFFTRGQQLRPTL